MPARPRREAGDDEVVELEGGASAPLEAGEGAEEAVIAAVLTDPTAYDDAAEWISSESFTVPLYRDVWDAIEACDAAGRAIDPLTVLDELERADRTRRVGGLVGLREIIERGTNHPDRVEVYARLVADRALVRNVGMAGRDIVGYAAREADGGTDALEFAERAVLTLGAGASGTGPVPMARAVPETLAELARAQSRSLLGHSTGFQGLDAMTGGVQPGQMVIVAARPGMGKSSLALQLARNIAESSGDQVAFLSYEMSRNELVIRALAAALAVPVSDLRQGRLPEGAEAELGRHAQRLGALPMVIDDRPPQTISGVRSSMRRLARRGPLAAIVLDYLQLLGGDRFSASQNRTAEVSEISRGLKLLARELDVPVIALSQLNRGLEQRPNKRPMLSDLRESGSLEQDADTVWMIYRDHVYHPESDPEDAEVLVVKQRQGAQGSIPLRWNGPATRFEDRPAGWVPPVAPLRAGGRGGEPW
jgi:replicative DNA helicase